MFRSESAAYAGKCLMKVLWNQYRFNRCPQKKPKSKHCRKSNLYSLLYADWMKAENASDCLTFPLLKVNKLLLTELDLIERSVSNIYTLSLTSGTSTSHWPFPFLPNPLKTCPNQDVARHQWKPVKSHAIENIGKCMRFISASRSFA